MFTLSLMPIKSNFKIATSIIIISTLLNACGGGGGGGEDNTPPERDKATISGTVFDAPVGGANVTAWEFNNGKFGRKLADARSDVNGNYSMVIQSASRPIIVKAEGGAYLDPYTKNEIQESNGKSIHLEAVLNYSEGSDSELMITPLTYVTTGLTKYYTSIGKEGADAIADATSEVNRMYGFDVNKIKPIDIARGGQSSVATSGHKYGAFLTAYSSLSYDLIDPNNESDPDLYTSIHLADIQYRDVLADGVLDGYELNPITGGVAKISFGKERVSPDLYTHDLSKHLMIVVNDSEINQSKTDSEDYVQFAQKISGLGTNNNGGIIPDRDDTPIDNESARVDRVKNDDSNQSIQSHEDILQGSSAKVTLKLTDDVGVKDANISLSYESLDPTLCVSDQDRTPESVCWVDYSPFVSGQRETTLLVHINTTMLDELDDSLIDIARLTVIAIEVEPAVVTDEDLAGTTIQIEWDNQAPAFTIDDTGSINSEDTTYIIKGEIRDAELSEKLFITQKGESPVSVDCDPPQSSEKNVCVFSHGIENITGFKNKTVFDLEAEDKRGNKGYAVHTVYKDTTVPTIEVSFPDQDMRFIDMSNDGSQSAREGSYDLETYTEANIEETEWYLNVNKSLVKQGVSGLDDNVDLSNFDVGYLNNAFIPYIAVNVSDEVEYDPEDETLISTPPEDMDLEVKCFKKREDEDDWPETGYGPQKGRLPHKAIKEGDNNIIYYLPYTKDTCGARIVNSTDKDQFKLRVIAKDNSGQESKPKEVIFKKTFNLPKLRIYTPFIGAKVKVFGIGEDGIFNNILGECTSQQSSTSDSDEKKDMDFASCEISVDIKQNSGVKVELTGDADFYQWRKEELKSLSPVGSAAHSAFGGYYQMSDISGSTDFYITELSAYQKGLFEYLWNKSATKDEEIFKSIIRDVDNALAGGTVGKSFFGFDPVVTRYALTHEIDSISNNDNIDPTGKVYVHRFLVEALVKIAADQGARRTSVDYANEIYDDLRYDGLANGKKATQSGDETDVNYGINESFYNDTMARAVQNVMDTFGVAPEKGQAIADRIYQADPVLGNDEENGHHVYTNPNEDGTTTDSTAPSVVFNIPENEGPNRAKKIDNVYYVAGEITGGSIEITDPSGIQDITNEQRFGVSFYEKAQDQDQPVEDDDLTFDITTKTSNAYQKHFNFGFNSNPINYQLSKIDLNIEAVDESTNHNGTNGPYKTSIYIDNEPPLVKLVKVGGVKAPDSDNTFFNLSGNLGFQFKVEDAIGDDEAERNVVFQQEGQSEVNVKSKKFYNNSPNDFELKLAQDCKDDEKCIELKANANSNYWKFKFKGSDQLNNATVDDQPDFELQIDSTKPTLSNKEQEVIGANTFWVPTFNWGPSNGKSVVIKYRNNEVKKCENEACSDNQKICLKQDQDPWRPQVCVPIDNDYDDTEKFQLLATGNAFPANTSEKIEKKFEVDSEPPTFKWATPWIWKDDPAEAAKVVGNTFSAGVADLKDKSAVAELKLKATFVDYSNNNEANVTLASLSQLEGNEATFEVSADDLQSIDFNIEDGIDKGQIDQKSDLYVVAVDKFGFETLEKDYNKKSVIIDLMGPDVAINPEPKDIYSPKYPFRFHATDLYQIKNQVLDGVAGVNADSRKYSVKQGIDDPDNWDCNGIYKQLEAEADELQLPEVNEDKYQLGVCLEAIDERGNQTKEQKFVISINSQNADLSDMTVRLDDTEINGTGDTYQINKQGAVKVTIRPSGSIDDDLQLSITGSMGEAKQEFTNDGNNLYTLNLNSKWIENDGSKQLVINACTSIKRVNESDTSGCSDKTITLKIQRGAPVIIGLKDPITIAQSTYTIVNKPVVEFSVNDSAGNPIAAVDQIKCWIVNDYDTDDELGKSLVDGSKTNICDFTNIELQKDMLNPSIVATVKNSNGAESDPVAYSFKLLDVTAPNMLVGTDASSDLQPYQASGNKIYQLKPDSIITKGDESSISLKVTFNDDSAGFTATNEGFKAIFASDLDSNLISSDSCKTDNDVRTLECKLELSSEKFMTAGGQDRKISFFGLKDRAELVIDEGENIFLLRAPKFDQSAASLELSGDQYFNKKLSVTANVEWGIDANRVDNSKWTVSLGTNKLDKNKNEYEIKGLDPTEECANCFTIKITPTEETLDSLVEGSNKLFVKAQDYWGNSIERNDFYVTFDKTKPQVTSLEKIELDTSRENYVFSFDITDNGSNFQRVSYRLDTDLTVNKTEEFTTLSIPVAKYDIAKEHSFNITAEDMAGNSQSKVLTVNSVTSKLALDFSQVGNSPLTCENNTITFKEQNLEYNIQWAEEQPIDIKGYKLTFAPSIGEPVTFSESTITWSEEQQESYTVTLSVQDGLSRVLNIFEIKNTNPTDCALDDLETFQALVDFQDPEIESVSAEQLQKKGEDDKYDIVVTAKQVVDENLQDILLTVDGQSVNTQFTKIEGTENDFSGHIRLSAIEKEYKIEVTANDLAGRISKPVSDQLLVVESSTPTLKIEANFDGAVSSVSEDLKFDFVFSEPVKSFDAAIVNVVLTTDTKNQMDPGEIKNCRAKSEGTEDKDGLSYECEYTKPQQPAYGKITLSVNGEDFQSENNIPGKGKTEKTFDIDTVLPQLTEVTFDPPYQEIDEDVRVELKFDKELQEATATLGANNITSLAADPTDKTVWTGTVTVPNVSEMSVGLVVSEYKDLVGNVGEDNTSYELPITPTLSVEDIGTVNGEGAANVTVRGDSKRFETSDSFTITAMDSEGSEVTVNPNPNPNADGDWSSKLDVSGLKDGTITVKVNGTNDLGAPAEAKKTFELTQTKPTVIVDDTSVNPSYAASDADVEVKVEVTATFDKGVTTPTGSMLGSTPIEWEAHSGTKTEWVGMVNVESVADSVKSLALTLKGFQDAAGNTGVEYRLDNALAITPTIAFGTINDVTGPTTATINGTSTRFDEGDKIEIKAVDDYDSKVLGSATVLDDGTWTVDLDLTTLKDGEITVYANGTNSLSAIADEMSTTFNYSSTTALVVPNYWESGSSELPSQKAA